ncbi:uncharacterized protein PODANS_5_10690 [Podospora anserina S mat+]|uniref:Podospora anserina S mat+ genomic DNA chromosome 5, supercontig 10 n=1 Tax=Podospora anserina (strain S / ATCC MYA-4624 / DSM 980 / FGSC 10383) TaxID=515849 RepID=B2APE1_PODAN|nr:uncharacterized protein PODANS_5_10690 [Podospora anserina S mat+]CAP65858.1 unnamed protein product [Podospora anserina S mat+]CDP30280.1 Putative protein of unknown function [Podospora anserina S mat+]
MGNWLYKPPLPERGVHYEYQESVSEFGSDLSLPTRPARVTLSNIALDAMSKLPNNVTRRQGRSPVERRPAEGLTETTTVKTMTTLPNGQVVATTETTAVTVGQGERVRRFGRRGRR